MAAVLIIDDEQTVRDMLSMILSRHGYEVLMAADGEEGLATFAARSEEIDLVLLDLSMPKMPGTEVLARIKDLEPDAQVVILTGFAEDVEGIERATEILYKPYRMEEFLAMVRRLLGE
jgi:two-component system response regulator PilR (NtrC family)